MPLPQIVTPEYITTLPSTGQSVSYRPFLVKEEKILLMAQEGKDQSEVTNAVIKILQECIKTPLDIKQLPVFDVEWLFLQLRSKSVGEIIKLNLRHVGNKECEHLNKIELPIADIKVTGLGKKDNIIIIDEKTGLGVELKYPNLALIDKMDIEKRSNTEIFKLITVRNVCWRPSTRFFKEIYGLF